MNPMLDLVVVIPNLNGEMVLGECLRAIPAAAGSLTWQAIVVDNASTDESAKLLFDAHPEVLLLQNDENLGFATACNRGGKAIPSRYVLLLNNDVTLSESSLQDMVRHADAHPKVGAVTPLMCWPDGRVQGPRLGPWSKNAQAVAMTWTPGTCLLLRRSALDAIEWLDEAFFFYNEDLDLSWRLRQAGWTLACLPRIRVRHHEGSSTRSDAKVRARAILEGYRGSLLLAKKHYAWAMGAVRLGLRLDIEWRAFQLERKRKRGETLEDRDEAFGLCLSDIRAALGSRHG